MWRVAATRLYELAIRSIWRVCASTHKNAYEFQIGLKAWINFRACTALPALAHRWLQSYFSPHFGILFFSIHFTFFVPKGRNPFCIPEYKLKMEFPSNRVRISHTVNQERPLGGIIPYSYMLTGLDEICISYASWRMGQWMEYFLFLLKAWHVCLVECSS